MMGCSLKPQRGARLARLCLGVCLACAAAAPSAATTLRPLSLDALNAAAEWVVRARVSALSARWEGGRIISEALLEPLEVLRTPSVSGMSKTSPPPAFKLRLLGGVVGDLAQVVPGSPTPKVGEEVVVFLRCRPDGLLVRPNSPSSERPSDAPECALVGLTQGYWRLSPDSPTATWAPTLSGVEWEGGHAPSLGGALDALRAP